MVGATGKTKGRERQAKAPETDRSLVSHELEGALREAVAERVGETRFGLWFGEGVRLGVVGEGQGDSVEVVAPNAYFRDRIKSGFAASVADAVRQVVGRSLPVSYSVQDEAEPRHDVEAVPERPTTGDDRRTKVTVPVPGGPRPSASPVERPSTDLPHRFAAPPGSSRVLRSLDDFVVGPATQLGCAAAREMVRSGGRSFNPLFIHGGVGLGKTHMLEGIAQGMRQAHPGLNVVHVTAEAFTNGFLEAMRTSSLSSFRSRYRGVNVLVIDDVHFLASKRATQEEFLHTFNALIERGVPIVLSSDQHPRRIAKLTDELATRFLGGMVVKLDAPDLETRKAIVRAKAKAKGVEVPSAVVDFIAEHVKTSVRELEGALQSVLAHASLSNRPVGMVVAKTALRETIRNTSQSVALRDVEKSICLFFQVEADDLKSGSRVRTLAYPRMLAMYLARKHAGASYSEIGRYFGGRNHSTVMSAEKKVVGWLKDDARSPLLPGFDSVVEILADLESKLGA
ncbi:chromosomal replication initiator protein DnaA [Planctomyces sp. SH-PL62]|uniref:chromosomal replication initiator protein DnaA n=1 Tax=Planctomyces sp. SH-PL62 TaxID=1636152 RepID=UPI00078CBDD3|nr:chromosomal replication initiator protein DnaA [Planctomyces sp. SH-PL62]AMV35791.1 Chromosomal replication initiator protein DnaA [Planctomyces sp. SH-PL62]